VFDFVQQPWFVPAIIVVVGLPIVMIVLTELHGALVRNGAHGTRVVLLLRNFVAPTGALLLLLAQTADVGSPTVNWCASSRRSSDSWSSSRSLAA